MNRQIEYIKANGGIITSVVVSLAAGFAAGYAVRANKYEKIVVDEEGNLFDESGETLASPKIEEEISLEDFKKNLGTVHDPVSDKGRTFIEGVIAEQKAIREELINEGTGFTDYDTIIDDGFPTYPSGRPDPRDIVLADDSDVEEIHWNKAQEEEMRKNAKIFVIHHDEFFEENTPDIARQSTLTYYPVDDILVDEDDTPIPNPSSVVGELMFGKGSGDPNVVYVRNIELHAEYEVINNVGSSFMEDVLGITQADSSA